MPETTTNKWLEAALEQHVHTSTDAGKYLLYFLGQQGNLIDKLEAGLKTYPDWENQMEEVYDFRLETKRIIRGYTVKARMGGIKPAETFNSVEFSHTLCNYIGYMLGRQVGDYLRGLFFSKY